jgi:hypothetical protein
MANLENGRLGFNLMSMDIPYFAVVNLIHRMYKTSTTDLEIYSNTFSRH